MSAYVNINVCCLNILSPAEVRTAGMLLSNISIYSAACKTCSM